MNELLTEFISNNFTPEAIEDIKRALDLFDAFNSQDYEHLLLDPLYNSNTTAIEQRDDVLKAIHKLSDDILLAHTIETHPGTSLFFKVEVMSALFLVMHLEDSLPFMLALESNDSDEEILAFIISGLSTLDLTDVMVGISAFRPSMLKMLSQYLTAKNAEADMPRVEKYLKTIKEFKTFTNRKDLIGFKLTEGGMLLGQHLKTYATFIQDMEVKDIDSLALNILSILYMSSDGFNSPILAYRKFSHVFFEDINVISMVEDKLSYHLGKFNEHMKAVYEKNRLSQAST